METVAFAKINGCDGQLQGCVTYLRPCDKIEELYCGNTTVDTEPLLGMTFGNQGMSKLTLHQVVITFRKNYNHKLSSSSLHSPNFDASLA